MSDLFSSAELFDLISRANLFNKLASVKAPPEANDYKATVYSIIHGMETEEDIRKLFLADILINGIPSGAVRCKDCKYTKTDGMEQPAIYCEKWDRWEMPEDFFCAYGYRKGGDDE